MELPVILLSVWFGGASLLMVFAWLAAALIKPRFPDWWEQVVACEIKDFDI